MSHVRLHVAIFDHEADFLAAARACTSSGATIVEAYSPHPVHGLDEIMGTPRSRLPFVTLAGGLFGLALGLWLQYWTSASDWPVNVGGKPFDSFPAFVPVAFELTILCAGLATVAGVLARSRLYPGRKPGRRFERTTDDRFALVVAGRPGLGVEGDSLQRILASHGAREAWEEDA
jgi:hypothetical protein